MGDCRKARITLEDVTILIHFNGYVSIHCEHPDFADRPAQVEQLVQQAVVWENPQHFDDGA